MSRSHRGRIIRSQNARAAHMTSIAAAQISNADIVSAVSEAMRRTWGDARHAVKSVARQVGRNPRAVRNWWEGINAPGAAELVELMRVSPEVTQEVLRLAGRIEHGSGVLLTEAQRRAAAEVLKLIEGS